MSNDRELLERAAKAAGIVIKWHEPEDGEPWCYIPDGKPPFDRRSTDQLHGVIWSPLADDGDALRLAVKLRIDFKCYGETVRTWAGDPAAQRVIASIEELCGADPYAATRRAIVRAAAAMVQ